MLRLTTISKLVPSSRPTELRSSGRFSKNLSKARTTIMDSALCASLPTRAEAHNIQGTTSLYQSVPVCTRLYKAVPVCTRLYKAVPVWTSLDQSVPVCTGLYQSVQGCTRLYQSVQGCTRLYKAVQVYTSLYQSVQGCTSLYQSVPVCASLCQYVPVCTSQAYCSLNDLTRLRKLHPLSSTSTRTSRRLATCDQGCHLRATAANLDSNLNNYRSNSTVTFSTNSIATWEELSAWYCICQETHTPHGRRKNCQPHPPL